MLFTFLLLQGNVLSTIEERKLLEYDEAIEAIDAAIEFKNELICGRGGHVFENGQVQREKVIILKTV